jgi:hypothetical protein
VARSSPLTCGFPLHGAVIRTYDRTA